MRTFGVGTCCLIFGVATLLSSNELQLSSELASKLQLCRVVASTAMNATSSRSHLVVQLTVVKRPRTPLRGSPEGSNTLPGAEGGDPEDPSRPEAPSHRGRRAKGELTKVGKLFMVDLAGSERLKRSLSTGAAPLKDAFY